MTEMWWRCGRCGEITKNDIATKCPKCNGKGYTVCQPVIDADEIQKMNTAFQWSGCLIREVPIRESPCNESCKEYRKGDCPAEVNACPEYKKFRSG